MHYFFFESIRVISVATTKADNAAIIIYALKGIVLKPIVATIPDVNITIIFLSFLKSLISKAKNVIITIGTPIDEYLNPKYNSFLNFFSKIKKYIKKKSKCYY